MKQLSFRLATMDDAQIIFDLSNDPAVRANSFNKESLDWENHISWLKNKLEDSNYIIILFFLENDFVGQVKFNKINDDQANMSMSIREKYRGKGLSNEMYDSSLDFMFDTRADIVSLVGYILPDNIANIKAATKSGYVYVDDQYMHGDLYHTYRMTRESRADTKKLLNKQ
jgi:UDP-2,4-diacetamido-2,4,6-trideoxy-beta-L-altropyranose hydrolase